MGPGRRRYDTGSVVIVCMIVMCTIAIKVTSININTIIVISTTIYYTII